MNKKIILASHGSLAEGMITAMDMILSGNHDAIGMGLDKYENPDSIANEIMPLVDASEGPIILITDIKGGSVYNELLKLCVKPDIYLITGMNLSMCLEIQMMTEEKHIQESLERILETSREGIELFSLEVLSKQKNLEDDELW